jgi:hypothetical protein
MSADPTGARGLTPAEVGRLLRVGPDRVRGWIAAGELAALNVADPPAKPRFVILPHHLAAFEAARRAGPAPKAPRKKRPPQTTADYYP